jgi:hypothetical protein
VVVVVVGPLVEQVVLVLQVEVLVPQLLAPVPQLLAPAPQFAPAAPQLDAPQWPVAAQPAAVPDEWEPVLW